MGNLSREVKTPDKSRTENLRLKSMATSEVKSSLSFQDSCLLIVPNSEKTVMKSPTLIINMDIFQTLVLAHFAF